MLSLLHLRDAQSKQVMVCTIPVEQHEPEHQEHQRASAIQLSNFLILKTRKDDFFFFLHAYFLISQNMESEDTKRQGRAQELQDLVISLQKALDRYGILHIQYQAWRTPEPVQEERDSSDDDKEKEKEDKQEKNEDQKETEMLHFELRRDPRNRARSKSFLEFHPRAPVEKEVFYGTIMSVAFPRWYLNWSWRNSESGQRVEYLHTWKGKQATLQVKDGKFSIYIWSLFSVTLEDDDIRKAIADRQKSNLELQPYKCPNWKCFLFGTESVC